MEPNQEQPGNKQLFKQIWNNFRGFFRDLTDLTEGLDREGTVFSIKTNRRMEGANAWMLMCSIMIASLGLDLNSPAVIIGAMLIAPLMAPILGVGLAVATNDFETLMQSLKNFGVAIGISIITSTVYFLLTPLGNPTEEITIRTAPTLLDVLIALFGGIAGIISTSRKDQSSAIPGVAIATALMPPLCVTGFGIATGNGAIALKSFYLFFLNSFFVALATYVIVRLLNFPQVRPQDERSESRTTLLVTIVSIILIVPSAFILAGVIKETRTNQRVDSFMRSHFADYLNYIDDWKLVHTDTTNRIIVKVYGSDIHEEAFTDYQEDLKKFNLENTTLDIIPTSEVDLEKVKQLETQLTGFEQIASQLTVTREEKLVRDQKIDSLTNYLRDIMADTIPFAQISGELKALFPDLESCAFAQMQYSDFDSYERERPVLYLKWPDKKRTRDRKEDEVKIRDFVRQRTPLDTIYILSQ